MKLNHLFPYIAHNTVSSNDRKNKYRILRAILSIRKAFQLKNDVSILVENYSLLKSELCDEFDEREVQGHLADFMDYPQVKEIIGTLDDDKTEDEEDDVTESEETVDDSDDEEQSDASNSNMRDALIFGMLVANLALSSLTLYTVLT